MGIRVKSRVILLLLAMSVMSVPFTAEAKTVSKKTKKEIQPETEVSSGIFKDVEISLTTSGELYFFDIISTIGEGESNLDYSGAQYRMEYEFEPVYLVSFQGYARWNSLKLNAGYRTNRFLSQNGSVDRSGDPASKLTTNKVVSSIINLGISYFDLNTSFRSVQFDCGRADVYTANTNNLVTSGQIKMNITDIDIYYDFHPAGRNHPPVFSLGYKYMEYSLPRIVYYFRDTIAGKEDKWVYAGETTPQEIRTRSHMGGFLLDGGGWGSDGKSRLIFATGVYFGGGRTEFDLNGSRMKPFMVTVLTNARAGFWTEFGDNDTRYRVSLMYEFNMIWTETPESDTQKNEEYSETKSMYTLGGLDFYHGITLSGTVIF